MYDIRFVLRTLRNRPLFAVTTIGTLALGIGAATTLFSAMNALGRGLPVPESESLVRFFVRGAADQNQRAAVSYPEFEDLRNGGDMLAEIFGHSGLTTTINFAEHREQVRGEYVSSNFFDIMRTRLTMGRSFLPEEHRDAGRSAVVVISEDLWSRLGQPPDIIGSVVRLSGRPFTVIGVAPAGFTGTHFAVPSDFWIPVLSRTTIRESSVWMDARDITWIRLMGRLAPGTTRDEASRRLSEVATQATVLSSRTEREITVTVLPERAGLINPNSPSAVTSATAIAFAMGAFIVLLACANVSSLLLGRGITRRSELGIRVAMGANRSRIAWQLFTETMVLALPAGAIGLTLSFWMTKIFTFFLPPTGIPLAVDFSPDVRVATYALAASLLAGALAAIPAVLASTKTDLVKSLRSDDNRGETSRFGAMNGIVMVQLALGLTMLVVAGLFVRTMIWYQQVDTGFGIENRVVARLNIGERYGEADGRRLLNQLATSLAAMPPIRSVSVALMGPIMPGSPMMDLRVSGSANLEEVRVPFNVVDTAYFSFMEIPMLEGRHFNATDDVNGRAVAIVSELFVKRHWPNNQAVGRTLQVNGDTTTFEVVGVAADVLDSCLACDARPYVYLPFAQRFQRVVTLQIHTEGSTALAQTLMREQINALDPNLEPRNVMTVADWVGADLWLSRTAATIAMGLGAFALVLASVGVYGVIALSVSQRTRELGLRIALGASRRDVMRLMGKRAAMLVGSALGVGLLFSIMAGLLLSSLVFGVSPRDPSTYGVALLLIVAVSAVATYLPARRAASVDPLISLKL